MKTKIDWHFILAGLMMMTVLAHGQETALPDSMLTLQKVDEYKYEDRALAERILAEIRDRQLDSDYEILRSEARLHYSNKEFREAIEIFERMSKMKEVRDDVQKQMSLLVSMADTYAVLNESVKESETIFETQTKEREIHKQRFWLSLSGGVILLFSTVLLLQLRFNYKTKKKNAFLIKTVDELITYRDIALKQEQEIAHNEVPAEGDEEAKEAAPSDETLKNYFIRINSIVINGKLYCQPDFDREQLIHATGIEKNRLSTIISSCTGTNIPGYINKLRVEYATRLMKEHPDYTLQAIAELCGFVTQSTFIRAFKMVFGMTPSEYRQAHFYPPPVE